jgi:hypothetical protein
LVGTEKELPLGHKLDARNQVALFGKLTDAKNKENKNVKNRK